MNTRHAAFVRSLIVGMLILASATLHGQPIERPLPFTISARDTSMLALLPRSDVAITQLSISEGGHFVNGAGERVRLFGCMVSASANFIPSADAEQLAKRLRLLGFNAVKLDDNDYWNADAASFFATRNAQGQVNSSSFVVNPVQLARFDTLFYHLKQNGFYIVFPLYSQHPFINTDGLLRADSLFHHQLAPLIDAKAAELVRGWAKTFLTHVNPLTGMRYADDPALAVLEYTNEASLYWFWNSLDRLVYINPQNYGANKFTISYGYSRHLDTLYNLFLKQKYGTDNAIRNAWVGSGNVPQVNLMDNASFENPFSPVWSISTRNGATAVKVDADQGIDSSIYVKLLIGGVGPNPAINNITFQNQSARLGRDTLYELTFWAKMGFDNTNPTKTKRNIQLRAYNFTTGSVALNTSIQIDTGWKKYTAKFRTVVEGLYVVQYQLGAETGDVWLDAHWLNQTFEAPPGSEEILATYGYKRLRNDGQLRLQPIKRIRDQVIFLDTLEKSYYASMDRLVKDTLKFRGLVNHRQNGYWTTLPDIYTSIGSDVTVSRQLHDYYSGRPGLPNTDSTWMVRNNPMVNLRSAGTLPLLSAGRIKGKPHMIGEYTTPYVNQHNVEHWTLLPAWGAYQDWDGLFLGSYARSSGELFADSLPNFYRGGGDVYSFGNNPAVLAVAPFAARLFRDGIVKSADFMATLTHVPDDVWLYPVFTPARGTYGVEGNIEANIFTQMKIEQSFNAVKHKVAAEYPYVADTLPKVSDSKELRWDEGSGRFTVTTPYLYAAAGLYTSDTVKFPTFSVSRTDKPTRAEHFTVYLYPLDTADIATSHDALMTIATRAQNTGITWVDSNGWGKNFGRKPTVVSAPTLYVEFVSDLDSVFVYPLDNTGAQTDIRLQASRIGETDRFYLNFDMQARKALWYRVVHKANEDPSAVDGEEAPVIISLSPNPATDRAVIRYQGERIPQVKIVDMLGRVVPIAVTSRWVGARDLRITLDCGALSAGRYAVLINDGANAVTRSLQILR